MDGHGEGFKAVQMEKPSLAFSKLIEAREAMRRRYRTIWHVPVVKKQTHVLRLALKSGMSVLDVGAGTRGTEHRISGLGIDVRYKSMDVDRNLKHDFYDLAEVDETFDAIILSQVIEHVTPAEGLALLITVRDKLKEGGLVLVSTPNVFHPNRFFTTVDHKSFYAYDELAGFLHRAGFEVESAFRVFNNAFPQYLLKVYVLHFLFRFLSIDYAYSIILVGRKPPAAGNRPSIGTGTPMTS